MTVTGMTMIVTGMTMTITGDDHDHLRDDHDCHSNLSKALKSDNIILCDLTLAVYITT